MDQIDHIVNITYDTNAHNSFNFTNTCITCKKSYFRDQFKYLNQDVAYCKECVKLLSFFSTHEENKLVSEQTMIDVIEGNCDKQTIAQILSSRDTHKTCSNQSKIDVIAELIQKSKTNKVQDQLFQKLDKVMEERIRRFQDEIREKTMKTVTKIKELQKLDLLRDNVLDDIDVDSFIAELAFLR